MPGLCILDLEKGWTSVELMDQSDILEMYCNTLSGRSQGNALNGMINADLDRGAEFREFCVKSTIYIIKLNGKTEGSALQISGEISHLPH